MGYKVLGFVVWQGSKLYARRRFADSRTKLAVAGISAAVLAGVVVAARESAANSH